MTSGVNNMDTGPSPEEKRDCTICLSEFTDPKQLPCCHVYCKECLAGAMSSGGNTSQLCPLCRKDIGKTVDQIDELPDYIAPGQSGGFLLRPTEDEDDSDEESHRRKRHVVGEN